MPVSSEAPRLRGLLRLRRLLFSSPLKHRSKAYAVDAGHTKVTLSGILSAEVASVRSFQGFKEPREVLGGDDGHPF